MFNRNRRGRRGPSSGFENDDFFSHGFGGRGAGSFFSDPFAQFGGNRERIEQQRTPNAGRGQRSGRPKVSVEHVSDVNRTNGNVQREAPGGVLIEEVDDGDATFPATKPSYVEQEDEPEQTNEKRDEGQETYYASYEDGIEDADAYKYRDEERGGRNDEIAHLDGFGGFEGGFGGFGGFGNDMFPGFQGSSTSYSYSSSSSSAGPGFSQSTSTTTKTNPYGVTETIATAKDSSGKEKVTVQRKVGDKAHTVTRQRDEDGIERERDTFEGGEDADKEEFEKEWKEATRRGGSWGFGGADPFSGNDSKRITEN